MKIVTLLIGLLTFSVVMTIMFSAVQNYLTLNEFGGASEWEGLAGDYETIVGESVTDDNSTLRQISSLTKSGEFASETKDIGLISGAISVGKLMTNFFFNFDEVFNKVGGDTNTYVDGRIIAAAIGIVLIIIVFSVIFFLRGFKAET